MDVSIKIPFQLGAGGCDSSYLAGRYQEVPSQSWRNSLRNPISEKAITKKGLVEWLKV
jgi:hypothetical protein